MHELHRSGDDGYGDNRTKAIEKNTKVMKDHSGEEHPFQKRGFNGLGEGVVGSSLE